MSGRICTAARWRTVRFVLQVSVGYPDFVYIRVLEPMTHYRPDVEIDMGNKNPNKLLRDMGRRGVHCEFGLWARQCDRSR